MDPKSAWRGRLHCEVPTCVFVIYIEGEPTEAGLDQLIGDAMIAHFAINHPGMQPTVALHGAFGEVLPPEGAYDGLGGDNQPKKLVN